MVDDHFRHGFPRADGSAKPHESPLYPMDRRSRTNLPSPYGREAGVRVTTERGGEGDVRKGRALLIVSHFCKAQ